MVRQVNGGRLVRSGHVIDAQFVIFVERVGYCDVQRAGIAFFSVFACVRESHTCCLVRFDKVWFPNSKVKSGFPTMKVIGAVVHSELMACSIEREPPAGDAVGESSHRRAEIGMTLFIVRQAVETQVDIGQMAIAIGSLKFDQGSAEIHDLHHHTLVVGAGKKVNLEALGRPAEGRRVCLHESGTFEGTNWR